MTSMTTKRPLDQLKNRSEAQSKQRRKWNGDGGDEQSTEWINSEAKFTLEQTIKRAELRIKHKPKLIDQYVLGGLYLKGAVTEVDFQIGQPAQVIATASLTQVKEFWKDVKAYVVLIGDRERRFFELLLRLIEERLDPVDVSESTQKEIIASIEDKSERELVELQKQVSEQEEDEFWSAMRRILSVKLANLELGRLMDVIENEKAKRKPKEASKADLIRELDVRPKTENGKQDRIDNDAMQGKAVMERHTESMSDADLLELKEVPVPVHLQRKLDPKRATVKPKYSNRVSSAFDWNEYNTAHYSNDEPPPKTVTGYKFNIFYPDLQDPSQTPSYKVFVHEHEHRRATIVFRAGLPYQDIAFLIYHRDWDQSEHYGFRSDFENGTLRLYFTFRKITYRH